MTDKEISKIDLAKYRENGKKGLILEVDLEYPRELHSLHNDYPVTPEKLNVSNNMLSSYCKKIAEKYNILNGIKNPSQHYTVIWSAAIRIVMIIIRYDIKLIV